MGRDAIVPNGITVAAVEDGGNGAGDWSHQTIEVGTAMVNDRRNFGGVLPMLLVDILEKIAGRDHLSFSC
jgi:hypothetical protein